ncbi:MAG: 30S ribosomal protein S27ae [Candidatus Diapherotrites archaeon]
MADEKKGDAKGGAKKEKKSHSVRKSSYYEIGEGGIKRTRKQCPKCGSGVFLAKHKDRHSCGKCKYTEWQSRG